MRTKFLNFIADFYGYKSYLEIGTRRGRNFREVRCKYKTGIDPHPLTDQSGIIHTTSNAYFTSPLVCSFDLIFIDGLHTEDQVTKDIHHALNHLTDNGMIVVHDCNPREEWLQVPIEEKRRLKLTQWCGEGWKSFARFRMMNPCISMCCVDIDTGLGIIRHGTQTLLEPHELTWSYLVQHRKEILNLMSLEEFNEMIMME